MAENIDPRTSDEVTLLIDTVDGPIEKTIKFVDMSLEMLVQFIDYSQVARDTFARKIQEDLESPEEGE